MTTEEEKKTIDILPFEGIWTVEQMTKFFGFWDRNRRKAETRPI